MKPLEQTPFLSTISYRYWRNKWEYAQKVNSILWKTIHMNTNIIIFLQLFTLALQTAL